MTMSRRVDKTLLLVYAVSCVIRAVMMVSLIVLMLMQGGAGVPPSTTHTTVITGLTNGT
jgi:hypothetical protein